MMTSTEYIEWALRKIERHPVGDHVSPIRRVSIASDLAQLAVDLQITLDEALTRHGKELNDEPVG